MRPLTLIRAVHWLAMVITGWSLNLLWGLDKAVGNGAPPQWERHVVGATILLAVAALAISVSGRGGKAPSRPAIVIALLGPSLSLLISYLLYAKAIDGQMPHLLGGSGWKWMTAGALISMGAAISSLILFFPRSAGGTASTNKASQGTTSQKRTSGHKKGKGSSRGSGSSQRKKR